MIEISCAKIWGGIKNEEIDVCSGGLVTTLYSGSADGGRGGDIYYLSVCGGDVLTRLALVDVTGHGRAVSGLSEWLYRCLEAHIGSVDDAAILSELNRAVMERGVEALATAALVSFHRADSTLWYSSAGHPPALLCRRGESRWKPVDLSAPRSSSANVPLGVLREAHYDQERLRLESGDRLFLYTDGVTEACGPDGGRFGEERLRSLLARNASRSLADLKTAVLSTLREFSRGPLSHDDVTLICVEVA